MPGQPARPRLNVPGAVNMAAALVVLVLVAVIALRAVNASPPAIAEFAPQAQQIKEAPAEQTSTTGNGAGGAATGAVPSPSPSAAALPSSAVFLRCVGDPPRQIEDPQSPPCVPYWQGNNGGATGKGVTGSSIEIVWINQSQADTVSPALAPALQTFFNSRFELYGRKLRLQEESETGISTAQEVSQADQIAVDPSPFASLRWSDSGGLQYSEELARKGVVSSLGFQSYPPESDVARYDPYLWEYKTSSDQEMYMLGRWYCAELAGKPALHAGPTLQAKTRKLGVVYAPYDDSEHVPLSLLQSTLKECGVAVDPVALPASNDSGGDPTLLLQMQRAGDTSIMCLCNGFFFSNNANSASSQGYYPEWLLSMYDDDTNGGIHSGAGVTNDQARDAFGLSFQPRQVQLVDDPMWWAFSEGDPGARMPDSTLFIFLARTFYESLLEIASGIQMAGPDLKASNFAAGLHRAVFPNPDTSIYAGHVGFPNGSHSMTIDAAEWWFDPTARSPYAAQGDDQGSVCYVAHGRRHQLSDWPPGPDPFDSGPCDSGG